MTHHFVAVQRLVVLLHEKLDVALLRPRLDVLRVQFQSLWQTAKETGRTRCALNDLHRQRASILHVENAHSATDRSELLAIRTFSHAALAALKSPILVSAAARLLR